jgi:hypothetical protein
MGSGRPLQAEDRAYRMGQTERVTVEYMLADGTLDVFIADPLEAKLRLIHAVEADVAPNASVLERGWLRQACPGCPFRVKACPGMSAQVRKSQKIPSFTAVPCFHPVRAGLSCPPKSA